MQHKNTPIETYEALYAQLQEIVARLDGGALPLEESLQLYERGVQLAVTCQQLLDTAELRVREIHASDLEMDS